jgi:DNA-binding transcriptional LysR family regulator
MNIHHLELFYYVARHGGISEAVRNMPYGIQQPAISGQVGLLEDYLGVTLFQRRPFALTPAGEELYAFIKPFFENVGPMAERLRGGVSQHLRIAASEIVLRDYLPALLQQTRQQFPKFKVTLREGYFPQVLDWFAAQEIDLSIGLLSGKPPPGIQTLPLFKLPLALIVPKASKLKSAEELWARDRIDDKLITVPSNEPIRRAFQEGLAKRKVDWFTGIEVSTVDLVQTYVANGYGIGVTVLIPKATFHPQVRLLPLPDFPVPIFGVLWQGRPTAVVNAFLDAVRRATTALFAQGDASLLLLPGGEDKERAAP